MDKLKLDTKKLLRILSDMGQNQTWLGVQVGMSKSLTSYHIRNQTVRGAEVFAPVFGVRAKDLLR